jgi:hypothetical protein
MPAPKFSTCYQFEDSIEAAVKSALNLSVLNCYSQRDDDVVGTPRTHVQFTTGAATEHYSELLSDSTRRPDMFQGTLQVGIVTNRGVDTADAHAANRGTIRDILYNFQVTLTDVLLPYHKIVRVMETGTTPESSADDEHDISTISFNLWFQIRPSAWP